MQVSRETRILNALCIALVLLAWITRITAKHTGLFAYNSLIFVLFITAAAIWAFQLKRRLLNRAVRRNLIMCVILMVFWMTVRTLKYEFIPPQHFASRYIWYLYYLPMLFIPLLMLLSVLSIGRAHNNPINSGWYLLFVPALAILAGILTNDIHQQAFCFDNGLSLWDAPHVSRGFVYYAAMAWMVIMFAAMLVVVFIHCAVPGRLKMIWVPLMPLIVGSVYTACVILENDGLIMQMITAPEIGCVTFAAFMECLMCVHLFPTNDNYGVFWNASSIGAGIMDKNGVIRYKSEHSIPVTQEQVQRAQSETVFLSEGNISLKSHEVRGGFGYWLRDISQIKRLNDELEALGRATAKENEILETENKMKAERLRIEQQSRLYDNMAHCVEKQLDRLSSILNSLPEDEAAFEQTMKYACILNAYIKRQANLFLLSNQSKFIDSGELYYAVTESVEYIRLCDIKAQCSMDGNADVWGGTAMLAYEVFEAVIESAVPGADNILVYLNITEDCLCMHMEVNMPKEIISDTLINDKIAALGGELEIETEENTEYVTLTLPSGGGKSDSLH